MDSELLPLEFIIEHQAMPCPKICTSHIITHHLSSSSSSSSSSVPNSFMWANVTRLRYQDPFNRLWPPVIKPFSLEGSGGLVSGFRFPISSLQVFTSQLMATAASAAAFSFDQITSSWLTLVL